MPDRTYPEGTFLAVAIAIGAAIGVPLGLAIGEPAFIGIGIAVGTGVGTAIGVALEESYKRRGLIRPATPEQRKRRGRFALAAIAIGVILAAIIIVLVALD